MERLTLRCFHCRALKRDLAARCPVPPPFFPTDRHVDRTVFANEPVILKATTTVAFKHAAEDDAFIRLLRAVHSGKEPASRADVGPEMAFLEMKAVGGMFQGKVEFNTMRIEKAAGVIHDHASKIEKLFPKGSDHKPTRALPEVWKDKVEFDAIAMEMAKAAIKLAEKSKTAQSTNDIKTEFSALAASCKACHKKYRAPED